MSPHSRLTELRLLLGIERNTTRHGEKWISGVGAAIGILAVWWLTRWSLGDAATPAGVFGYQDRYYEYRHQPSQVSGEFRSTLNHWHYAQSFASDPALNSTFITCTPTKRTNAVTSTDVLWCMINHSVRARRMVNYPGVGKVL